MTTGQPVGTLPGLLRGARRVVARPLTSLVVSGVLLSVLIALAGFVMATDLYDGTIRTTHRDLTSLATVLAEQADRALQAIELVQDAVADDILDASVQTEADLVRRASLYGVHDRLRARISGLPQVNAITLIDQNGNLLNFSRYWPIPLVNVIDRDYFHALSADPGLNRFVSEPVLNRGDGTFTLYIARKLRSPGGAFLGLVLGAVELRYFETLYAEVAAGPEDVISMFRTDGVLVARFPTREGTIGRSFPTAGPVRIVQAATSRTGILRTRSPIDGRDRFVSTKGLAHYPFVLSVSRTASAALAEWREEAIALGVAVALLVGGLCLTVALGARQIRGQRRLACAEAARAAAEERERGERLLREHYARFGTALDNMTQGLCLFDATDRLVVLNARFAALYGVPPALRRPGTPSEALLDHIRPRVNGHCAPRSIAQRRDAAARCLPDEETRELADGRVIAVIHAPVPGGGWMCTHEDVTERREAEATIVHMAHHDALTELPNRVLLRDRVERLIGAGGRRRDGALLLLDLDGFKQVNDVHGHLFGDALLRLVARRLRDHVEPGDLLARLGGDEFAIVRDGHGQPGDASALAERIVAALCQPFRIEGVEVTIGTSIGLALAEGVDQTSELLLRHADIALYRAKAAGRGMACLYEARMDVEIRGRQTLEADLRRALARHEFELHYQPIFKTRGGGLTAFEALVRWRHPVRGLVGPGAFIPVCEEIGLIQELGAWVLERACTEAAAWPAAVKVAVNLSPVQFRAPDFAADVRRVLAATGLAPQRLELEITESVMLQDDRTSLAILQDLHGLGVRISMDDFGTGYSSLSYLRRFPFDKIKIDQSFVRDLCSHHDNVAIVRAAIGLGHALGMTVLAEGVETAEQAAILEAEGCHEVQGYLFGRPAPLGAAIAMLSDRVSPAAAGPELGCAA